MKYVGNSNGKPAVSYSFNGNFFYLYFKKHLCPVCNSRLKVEFVTKTPHNGVNSSKWGGATYYENGVTGMEPCFYCEKCKKAFSVEKIKNTENGDK